MTIQNNPKSNLTVAFGTKIIKQDSEISKGKSASVSQ